MVYQIFGSSCAQENANGSSELTPSVSDQLQTGITILYCTLYFTLFIIVYVQLWLILYYRYKRISFQTTFLFLCVTWSGLRTVLFSFYIQDTRKANTLPLFWYWLLYCFPVCLQFFTLCLLNLYFSQVMFKAKPQYAANPRRFKNPLRLFCFSLSAIFLTMNVLCAVVVQHETSYADPDFNLVSSLITARVLVNDVLFIIGGAWLTYCIIRISKTTSATILLEARRTTVCQATTVGVLILVLYTSRAIYNLLAISPLRCNNKFSTFDFDWYNVSDQADLVFLSKSTYLLFGIVLFVWELFPTTVMIFFFRVKRPVQNMVIDDAFIPDNCHSRVYFFDNPHRYDSDDDHVGSAGSLTANENMFHTISPRCGSILVSDESYNPVHPTGANSFGATYPNRTVRQQLPYSSHA